MHCYVELAKPRLTALALVAALVGFLMASYGPIDWVRALVMLAGSALVGAGGNALNQWYERDTDALMRRTAMRPLPTRRLQPARALAFGVASSVIGVAVLAVFVNALAALLAAITCISYVGLYTPMKRSSALCTLVGAVPGAMPPLIGWAAARGSLSLEAWMLFAIVFLWQLPHFLAIAWLYQDDYAHGGLKMLPLVDFGETRTARQIVLYSVALLPASLLPVMIGLSGRVYFWSALIVGLWFIATALLAAWLRTRVAARRLFISSISYLPLVMVMMVADKGVW